MKKLIQKAKDLLADGKHQESIELIKKISDAIKKSITLCPNCEAEVVSLRKDNQVHAECPKCGAMWGHKEIKDELLKVKEIAMEKKDILSKLWKLYQEADPDVTPFDINSFDATGWLKKSLAEKVAKDIDVKFTEVGDLKKSDDKPTDGLINKKQSDALSKDDVIQIMLDMFKNNEEPNLINRHTITRYEATNEINTDVLKTVYRKAGKDVFELCKADKPIFDTLEKGKGDSVYEWTDKDHKKFEHGGYPFAVIGDKTPKGYKQTASHFVDSSGMGREGEAALTQKQFHAKLQPGKFYGITGHGKFQVHVGEFERDTNPKKTKKDVDKCNTMVKQMPRIKATTLAPKPGKAGKVTRSASKDTNLAIRAQKPITKADDGDDDDDAPWSGSQKNMQRMIDNGQVWRMEGSMGRAAMEGIKSGHLILGPKSHKDYWGNHVPAHHEVKPGTHGSPEYAKEKTGYVHPDHVEKETKVKKGMVRGVPDGTGPHGRGMGAGKGKADGSGLKAKKETKVTKFANSEDFEKRAPSAKAQAKKLKEEINGHLQTKMYGHNINIMDIGALSAHAEKIHASGKSPEDAATEAFDKFKQAGKITTADTPVTKK